MKLLSNRSGRSAKQGFTLLETLLAFAIASLVLAGVYTVSARSLTTFNTAQERYFATELARSLLDEIAYANAPMADTGQYKQAWNWEISSTQVSGLRTTPLDTHFAFYEVTAIVSLPKRVDLEPVELTRVITRRAQ